MRRNFTLFFTVLALFLFTSSGLIYPQNFLTTSGIKIVDKNGNEVHFKGMGLGGWLEPEGYMFLMSGFANSPSQIHKKIQDLIGVDNTNNFYNTFRKNFVTEADIRALAGWGFNLVRLPFHYNVLTPADSPGVYSENGFAIFDSLITWCRKYNIYIILDMHCAPGGESDQTISDYDSSVPSLWQDTAKQTRTVDIWRTIAARYKDEPVIAGYDLLNEPRWDFPNGDNTPLRNMYVRITQAIRSVDTVHILFCEGNQYATDFSKLTPPWDSKLVYSFHKYWNGNDMNSIQGYLNLRTSQQVPLWHGESGENSNTWYTECITLFQQNDIGWSWWTLKKFGNVNDPLYVNVTTDYTQLLSYWQSGGTKPTVTFANNTLLRMADNLKFENCVFQKDVIDAMFRQVNDNSTLPYADNTIPGIIFASDYDMGRLLSAYKDNDYENTGGSNTVSNAGGEYRNDGVDIETSSDFPTNGYDVGWINAGEWMKYTVNVTQAGTYDIDIRYASNQSGAQMALKMDGNIINIISTPVTGGWQDWQTVTLHNVKLTAGSHQLTTQSIASGYNLNCFIFTLITADAVNDKQQKFVYNLAQNYPNPFNPSTIIKWQLAKNSLVTLKVYNILGNEVATLVNQFQNAGEHSATLNMQQGSGGRQLASGVYFYKLHASDPSGKTGDFVSIKKMILMK